MQEEMLRKYESERQPCEVWDRTRYGILPSGGSVERWQEAGI